MNKNCNSKGTIQREVVGLMPAAGKASRISPLPCSKELLPVGFRLSEENGGVCPKVISHYLLEAMQTANIHKVYVILRHGKWDIPSYYGDGKMLKMHFAYLMMNLPFGVPYTLDQAYPFVGEALVALGFPDMIIHPEDAFVRLLSKQAESSADIVLGLFPAARPHKTDMVEVNGDGRVVSIQIKPEETQLLYAWELAVWTPDFTNFMHDYLLSRQKSRRESRTDFKREEQTELQVSDIIQAAIEKDMHVDTVLFKDGNCLDIGTPEDLLKPYEVTFKASEHFREQLLKGENK